MTDLSIDAKVPFKVKVLNENAQVPTRANEGDIGYDLYAAENVTIYPNSSELVSLGIQVEFPSNYGVKFMDRSGMATKDLRVGAGVIDSVYRGDLKVLLYNHSDARYHIDVGDRIAQMVILPKFTAEFEIVEELTSTDRGEDGFGSSGK